MTRKTQKIYPLVRVFAVALLLLITLISCSNTPSVYTVTFNANGGTINGEETIKSEVIGGLPVAEPSAPTKTGHQFDGWFLEGNSSAYDFSTPVNSDLTLVAKWTRTHYVVTFDPDGGTLAGSETVLVDLGGNTVTKPTSDPTRQGYLFAGWFEKDSFKYYDFSAEVNSDLTIVAKWTNPDHLEFTLNTTSDGYIVKRAMNYSISGMEFAIPKANSDGKPVVAIEDNAFDAASITAIAIPESVKLIGYRAFYACGRLSTVTFEPGSNLSEIGSGAFSGSSPYFAAKITSIEIPKSVTTIGDNAFGFCASLSTITFESGSSLSSIQTDAFCNTAITSITIPESVITMGSNVFSDCNYLKTIHIGTESVPDTWNTNWKGNCTATVYNRNEVA